MEFSSDYNSFQLKSVNNKVMDFSTDYASLTLRRKRSSSVLVHTQKNNSTLITFMMKRLACLLKVLVIMLLSIVLHKVKSKNSDIYRINYLTMVEELEGLSTYTIVNKWGLN